MRTFYFPSLIVGSLFLIIGLTQPRSLQAIGGEYGSPCSAPGDLPTVGGIVGGNGDLQTYSDPQGRVITRVCMAWRWGDGKLDHGHTRVDYTSKCYSTTGIGTSTVTVKRIATTFQTASWETGPEAGACRPLEHLDLFMVQPASAASPTPAANTDSTDQNTKADASPTPVTKTVVSANSDDQLGSVIETETQVDDAGPEPAERSPESALSSPSPQTQVLGLAETANQTTAWLLNLPAAKFLINRWWLFWLILLLMLAIGWWWWRRSKDHSS